MATDASRFPSGVLIDQSLALARPVGTLVTNGGVLYRSTNAVVATYVALTGASAASPAGVLIVATADAPYSSVEDALADAAFGDTVLVYPGNYNEAPLTIPAGVMLMGFGPTTSITCTTAGGTAITTGGAGCMIRDLGVVASGGAGPVGVDASGFKAFMQNVAVSISDGGTGIAGPIYGENIRVGGSSVLVAYSHSGAIGGATEIYGMDIFATATAASTEPMINIVNGATARIFDVRVELLTAAGSGVHAAGVGTVAELHDIVVINSQVNGFHLEDAATMNLYGCSSYDAAGRDLLTDNDVGNILRCIGCNFTTANIVSAAAGSILPPIAGKAVITTGNSSVAVDVAAIGTGGTGVGGAAYATLALPAFAALNEVDGVITVVNCTWAAGALTVRTSAVTTGDRDVAWHVPGLST